MFLRNPAADRGHGDAAAILWSPSQVRGSTGRPVRDPRRAADAPVGDDAWLGTDYLGRDVLTHAYLRRPRDAAGRRRRPRCCGVIGVVVGALAGFYGGSVDAL